MASATNSRGLERLAADLAAAGDDVPLLVFRLPALERTAWRDGLRAARSIERRAGAAFTAAATRVLRAGDRIAHDHGTDTFVAALTTPTRDGHRRPAPIDVRSALARIATTMEHSTQLDVDAGWTRFDAACGEGIGAAVARALIRGAQERERYAFFSAVGHELRTPLASIHGYLETLLSDDTDAATRQRFVRIAHGESLRMTRLLEGMFEISLLDLTATAPLAAAGSLETSLAVCADACAASAARRGVAVHIAELGATPVAIDGDRLALVLINVIDNAIKHGRRGGRIDVDADVRSPRAVVVTIDDDGPGIPVHERERLFALGQRGATTAPGTGIGLALARMILERAGARIDVHDSPLGGVRFSLIIPRSSDGTAGSMRRRGVTKVPRPPNVVRAERNG